MSWNFQIFNKFQNFHKTCSHHVNLLKSTFSNGWSPSVPNKYISFIQSGCGTKNPRKRFTLPVHSHKNYEPLNSQTTLGVQRANGSAGNRSNNFPPRYLERPKCSLALGRWPRAIEHIGLCQYLGKNILILFH
jgi:hypothetical protein